MGSCFLGRDRAFRSYYYFHQFSTIIVENPIDDGSLKCHEPTPLDRVVLSTNRDIENIENNQNESPILDVYKELKACSGDSESCSVHNLLQTGSKLLFYAQNDGIKRVRFVIYNLMSYFEIQLLESLNPRGFREIELSENINFLKDIYSKYMNRVSAKYGTENFCQKLFGLKYILKEGSQSSETGSEVDNFQLEFQNKLLEIEQNVYFPKLITLFSLICLQIHEKKLGILLVTTSRDTWRQSLQSNGDTLAYCEDNVVYLQNSLTDEILYTTEDLNGELNAVQREFSFY